MEHTVTTKKWYVVTGTAGATVTSPDGSKTFCTVPEGGQGVFYATAPKVVTSDDSVEVFETTFNSAPVKLKLLGLLGGGVSNGLPSGYLAAEFLESTGTQYIDVPYSCNLQDAINVSIATEFKFKRNLSGWLVEGYKTGMRLGIYNGKTAAGLVKEMGFAGGALSEGWNVIENMLVSSLKSVKLILNGVTTVERTNDGFNLSSLSGFRLFADDSTDKGELYLPKKWWKAKLNNTVIFHLISALDPSGTPCMFDKVNKQPFYNRGTDSFIVGMTMAQARKLSKLPSTGGTLKISLPSNYAEDEGVVNALATAQERGWVITIQTYEAEAGAASTFALRRIWVRKTQDEQGRYVASDGTRWQVDWCVDVVGADPQELGYEPFRSVESAVEYWGLMPWVDPEAEEELLTNTDEQ